MGKRQSIGKGLQDGARVDRNIFARVAADGRITAFQVKIVPPGGTRSINESFESLEEARSYRDSVRADLALEPYRERVLRAREVARAKRHIASLTMVDLLTVYAEEVTPTKKNASSEGYMIDAIKAYPIGKLPVVALSAAHVRTFAAQVEAGGAKGRPRSKTTVGKYLSLVSHALKWARFKFDHPFANVVMDIAPTERRTNGDERERRLNPGEEGYLRAALAGLGNPYVLPLFELAIETGARQSELLNLAWSDVNLADRVAIARDTKNGKDRPLLLSRRAVEVLSGLKSLPIQDLHGRVVRMDRSNLHQRWGVAKRDARRSYEQACAVEGVKPDAAFLEDLRWHDLRHEAITRVVEAGFYESLIDLQAFAGHEDPRMTLRYVQRRDHSKLAARLG